MSIINPSTATVQRGPSTYDRLIVKRSPARRRVLRLAARELLVRGGAASGVALGFLWALQRPAPAPPAACERAGSDGIGECFGGGLVATLMPYIRAMGAGAIAGVLIGMLISAALSGREGAETAATPTPTPVGRAGRWITARYDGECRGCGSSIATGDHIFHGTGHTLCARCGP